MQALFSISHIPCGSHLPIFQLPINFLLFPSHIQMTDTALTMVYCSSSSRQPASAITAAGSASKFLFLFFFFLITCENFSLFCFFSSTENKREKSKFWSSPLNTLTKDWPELWHWVWVLRSTGIKRMPCNLKPQTIFVNLIMWKQTR